MVKTELNGGLFEILNKIKARPGLYIGHPSVSNLFMFLVGYKTARRELEIGSPVLVVIKKSYIS